MSEPPSTQDAQHKNLPILCVGLTCIDVISYCDRYPDEDTDMRCEEQRWCLGGNACNNVCVLKQLGADARLFTAMPTNCKVIVNNVLNQLMNEARIAMDLVLRRPNDITPCSTVIVSTSTGTRTIQHARNVLHEPTAEEFMDTIGAPSNYSWIHFEGRNFTETRRMIDHILGNRSRDHQSSISAQHRYRPMVSVECEKVRPEPLLEQLIPGADFVFISKDFARKHGAENMTDAVRLIRGQFADNTDTTVICPWGDQGAAASLNDNTVISVRAHVPVDQPIIDTLGAGDTFVGATVYALNCKQMNVKDAVAFGCYVAGQKCAQRGIMELKLEV